MEHEDLIAKLDQIRSEIDRMNEANEFDPANLSPRFVQLISDGVAIKNELDPVLREIYKNRRWSSPDGLEPVRRLITWTHWECPRTLALWRSLVLRKKRLSARSRS